MNKQQFQDQCKTLGITIDERQCAQFETYMKCLIEWNEKMNLTAITEEEEIWEKHFYDSIVPFANLEFQSLCDVGSGAGFPGIPVKIVNPSISLTIIEPLQKRCRFLQEVVEQLQLDNVQIICARAEDHAKDHRESFDVVSARAVARLPILLELCVPFVKINGMMVALKGKQGQEEFAEAQEAMRVLGIECIKEETFDVGPAKRINYYFKKVRSTPKKYPRVYGQIKKRPIGG